MRQSYLVVVAALAAVACAQDANATAPAEQPQVNPYPWFTPFQPQGDVNGVLAGIAMQMQYSQLYGKFILDFQIAQGWVQVAESWVQMSHTENGGQVYPSFLEESDSDNDLEEEEDEEKSAHITEQYTAVERQGEIALLHVLKIMYLQAAQKLQDAKASNYANKAQLALLVQAGIGQVAPQIIYLGYYLESLHLISSGITIQRQDAWNTWLHHEIMETDEFDNSADGVPETFVKTMALSREVAMQLYYTEAQLDLQIYMMDYYLQSMLMSLLRPAANQAATSFVEEESTAEPAQPSKPFFPFMMMGGMAGGPQYIQYISLYLKYFTVIMNFQAAQGLYTHAHIDAHDLSSVNAKYGSAIKQNAVFAFQQWAYLKYQGAMLQMYGLFTGSPVPSAANNNNNNAASQ